MARFGFVVAVLAAAAAAWLAVEVTSLKSTVEVQRQEIADLRSAGTGRVPAPVDPQPTAVVRTAASDDLVGAAGDGAVDGAAPSLSARPDEPAALATKVAALEERLKAHEQTVSSLRRRGEGSPVAMGLPKFLHDVDSATKALKLDDRQKAEVERIVEDSKRALEDLRNRPNDEGVTWKEATKIKFEGSADGGMIAFGGNFEKMEAFKKSKVPGTNETYGEAEQRIRRNAKDSMRRVLTPEQQKTFDESHTDPLFGGGGGIMSTFITTDISEVEVEGK
jgi:hypothetical protein